MSLTHYNPWSLFDQLQHEMHRMPARKNTDDDNCNAATSDWVPAVDIKEDDNQYLLVADIPGVDPKNIDIHMENNILTIQGERNSELKADQEGIKRIERQHGVFYRRFTMPEGVNAEGIQASSNHGVLTLQIPKQEATKARKISVN